ncbi:phosphomannomutase/phosphoglucomutase [Patescibacteria group bacterium]
MKIVSGINPHIFRGYDIRGVADKDLSEDVYYTLGRGYATYLSERRIKECVVGRDNRLTGELYSNAFIKGLNDGGVDTYNIGLSLSQIVYFSSYHFKTKGTAMLTASHNPKEYNGLKLGTGYSETMVTDEIIAFRDLVDSKKFSKGSGKNTEIDIFPDYKEDVLKHFSLKKKWKVVIDACNTTSGMFYPEILRGAGCEVIEQNTELDGSFPLGVPDPTEVEVLERLAEGVKKANADIGFAYDTDGDRMAVVNEKGEVLYMDTAVALFAQDILDYMPGAPIVYNTFCSRQVTEAIEKAGGKPVMEMTGHSFIKARIKQEKAPFGGELSGHIFFFDNFYGHDDGAYASIRLLQYLERTEQSLSEAVSKLSQYYSSPEIKLGLADDIKFQLIANEITDDFKKTWPKAEFINIDGVRMDLPDRMAIVRASQNGPYVGIKFEAKNKQDYDLVKTQVRDILKKYPQIKFDDPIAVNTHALE